MQRVQLYIEGQRVDLFQDETIEVTSTIQDIKDIGKIFTDYSQTFTVPASSTNNKIFRHYYNNNITEGYYDSRIKKEAEIHINYLPFREGKVYLNSVKMMQNKAHSYTLTFYGKLVSLKDAIGDDKLSSLDLEDFTHQYDNATVKEIFQNGLTVGEDTEALIYPLITSRKRLFYNTEFSDTDPENTDGNLYRDPSSPDNLRGLEYRDLKPAIRIYHIIKAIEARYSIQFTDDFFSTTNEPFYKVYMWLSAVRGEIYEQEEYGSYASSVRIGLTSLGTQLTEISSGEGGSSSVGTNLWNVNNTTGIITLNANATRDYRIDVLIDSISENSNIKVKLFDVGANKFYERFSYGSGNLEVEFVITKQAGTHQFRLFVEADTQLEFMIRELGLDYVGAPSAEIYKTPLISLNPTINLSNKNFMPDMGVMDFLTGLFKMFNLTAYYITDRRDADYGKIFVDTLDEFYKNVSDNHFKGLIDLTEYTDITSHDVDSVLPFTEIYFKYQDPKYLLSEKHQEASGEVFGDSTYNVRKNHSNVDIGKVYEIKLPFSHMKYERLIDGNKSAESRDTLIQWGYSASGEFNYSDAEEQDDTTTPPTYASKQKGNYDPVLDKPLLFYANKMNISGATERFLNWIYKSGQTSTPSAVTSYFFPANSINDGTPTVPPSATLNFDVEDDEWQNTAGYAYFPNEYINSLYNKYYRTYISDAFDATKRLHKVTVNLPAYVVLNYRLNDKIKIQDSLFTINSISTNLNTGKTQLELLTYRKVYESKIFTIDGETGTDGQVLTADITTITADRTDIFV